MHWSGRTDRAYAFADLLAAGGTIEIGSDAPVSPLDPWDGIASAVTRTDDDRPAWHPEQAIPLETALAAAAGGRAGLEIGADSRPGDRGRHVRPASPGDPRNGARREVDVQKRGLMPDFGQESWYSRFFLRKVHACAVRRPHRPPHADDLARSG